MPERTVQLLYSKANHFGLSKDVTVLMKLFSEAGGFRCSVADPHEPPKPADINIHLEVPVYANVPWAPVNVLLVNPEYYVPTAFDGYAADFDALIVRDAASAELFRESFGSKVVHLPGLGVGGPGPNIKRSKEPLEGWLWVIGGSARKMAAARAFLPLVEAGDDNIKIITSREDYANELRRLARRKPVVVEQDFLELEELQYLQKNYRGHIVLSEAEGFSHAAAEARQVGALVFSSRCPVLVEVSEAATVFTGAEATKDPNGRFFTVDCSTFSRADWLRAQEALVAHVPDARPEEVARAATKAQWLAKINELRSLADERIGRGNRHLPPILLPAECPEISIVTPTYNRRRMIDLAFHNLMWSDYPISKIEWIVVDDSDDINKSASDKIVDFASRCPDLKLEYVPLAKRHTVGEKRNIGCARATRDIIVFMDDDDHYPQTSLRRRVAWLLSQPAKKAACCTMMAMYDLVRGTSAVNVPPWALPLGQRVSEATLTFKKEFWDERPFAETNIAEGEEWLAGREAEVIEMPPQQLIVAMSHGDNISSRRMPADAKPSCFWGFGPDMLKFLHGLAGMQVEFEGKPKTPKKK
jgi:hypothetical protein